MQLSQKAVIMALVLPALGLASSMAVSSAAELQAQLNAAIAARAPTFTIPAGTYNFSTANLNVSGASALLLVADGATALFRGAAGVNITNCEALHVRGLSITYESPVPHGRRGVPGITYNVFNSSSVLSEDITIFRAPFFAVTAFNGGVVTHSGVSTCLAALRRTRGPARTHTSEMLSTSATCAAA